MSDMIPSRSSKAGLVVMLGSVALLGPLSIDMYLPALPVMIDDLNTSQSLIQMTLTAFMMGMVVGQLAAGPFSDKYGRRGPLLFGLATYTIISLLCAFTSSITVFILLRFLQGCAGAAALVVARAMLRDYYTGHELTRMFTLLTIVYGAGPILAPIFGGLLMMVTTWHGIFAVLSAVGLVVVLFIYFKLPESLDSSNRASTSLFYVFHIYRKLISQRMYMGFAFMQGFVFAALFSYIMGSSFVFQDLFGLSAQQFGLLFAINGVGFLAMSQITGWLVGRVNETSLLITGLSIAMAGAAGLLLSAYMNGGVFAFSCSFFLIVSSVGMVAPISNSLAMQTQPKHMAGSAAAMLGVLSLLIGGLISALTSLLGSESAMPLAMAMLLVVVSAWISFIYVYRYKGSGVK